MVFDFDFGEWVALDDNERYQLRARQFVSPTGGAQTIIAYRDKKFENNTHGFAINAESAGSPVDCLQERIEENNG